MTAGVAFRRVATNGVVLNVAEAGPPDGPLVILLHGFPETWYGWRHQIGPLVAAGYRVLVPDQRGYGTSDKPRPVAAYRLEALVGDLIGLLDGLGSERAAVVGHDWGGIVAWAAIDRHPDRFDRAVILNAPHPGVMQASLRSDLGQIRRSWYVFAFQIPLLAEFWLKRQNFQTLARGLVATSRPGAFAHADIEIYRSAWEQPGALRAMLGWYRAALRGPRFPMPDRPIRVPTLLLWGAQDHALGPGLARSSFAQCQTARIEWFPAATHWIAHEEPDRVNALILDWLKPERKTSGG